jgi:hypothetical protein
MENKVKEVAVGVARKNKQKRLIETEAELLSIETRINDLEWQYEQSSHEEDLVELLDQRRRAIDKKKYMITEVAKLKIELMEEK